MKRFVVINELADVLDKHFPHPERDRDSATNQLYASALFYAKIASVSHLSEEETIDRVRTAYRTLVADTPRGRT